MFKYTKNNLNKIEEILKESQYTLRYEKGNFKPGYCILEDKRVVIVNKYYTLESKINCLIEILNEIGVDENLISADLKVLLKQLTNQQPAT